MAFEREEIIIEEAERSKAKLKLALCGPSGSGKTKSALYIAQGLGGKIGLIDTENSATLYSNVTKFGVHKLTAPYSPERYMARMERFKKEGYNVLILDSISPLWAGEGGILDIHARVTKEDRTHNGFAAWRIVTPIFDRFIHFMQDIDMHVIATIRAKETHELVTDDNGRKKPVKMGLEPIQRNGIGYEFTLCLDMFKEDNNSPEPPIATSSKDRTDLFYGKVFTPSVETGKQLLEWLNKGKDEAVELRKEIERMILDISSVDSLDVLKSVWIDGSKKAEKVGLLPAFEAAKDKRKDELMNLALAS
jgi:hypothetical protein